MILTAIVGAKLAEQMSNSPNPWIYLAGLLLIGLGIIARKIFIYMVDTQKELKALDEEHRNDSKGREKTLLEQVDKSNNAFRSLAESQKEMADAQKEIVTAVQSLNGGMQSLETRMDTMEKYTFKKESA
ncbi:hypothetical protein ACOMCU_24395 [Lysinibacillus sp. UGB7]|uniref:hypothetical protein n=1 Tax=Lysinibacillus sp. UGB7 TaxID=3411039 RepID=UPI003B7CC139